MNSRKYILRIGIPSAIVALLIVASVTSRLLRREARLARSLQEKGHTVYFDDWGDNSIIEEIFGNVTHVSIHTSVDDWYSLTAFPHLSFLSLSRSDVSDEDLTFISEIESLESISLGETKITGEGLRHLIPCENLTDLGLRASSIRDSDLEAVGKIKNLKSLNLENTAIGDKGISFLRDLKVTHLYLSGTKVTDSALSYLNEETIRKLDISETQINGGAIEHLRGFKALEDLIVHEGQFNIDQLKELNEIGIGELSFDINRLDKGQYRCTLQILKQD